MIHGGSSRATGANIILVGSECRIGNLAGYLQFEVNDPEHTNGYGMLNFSTQNGLTQTLKDGTMHYISDSARVSKLIQTNGYIRFVSGLTIQWGTCYFSSSTSLTYPITFTSARWTFCAMDIIYDTYSIPYSAFTCLRNNESTITVYKTATQSTENQVDTMWLAIGF